MLRLALVPLFASAVVLAQDPEGDPETCHDVAARILEPRIAAVEAAERGLAEYDHRNELYAQEQQAWLDANAMTEHIAQAALDAQRSELEQQQEAVAEARGAAVAAERARAAELSAAAAERRAGGATDQAEDLERQVAAIEAAIAEGRLRFEVPGQSRARPSSGWDDWLESRGLQVDRTAASVAEGSYSVRNPFLDGKRLSWASARAGVERYEKELARIDAGAVRWYLDAVSYKYDRAGIEGALERALEGLRTDREDIRAGTYPVSTGLGYRADRNHVEGLIADAERGIRDKQAAWAAKTYQHVHRNGTRPTNGSIEEEIAAAQKVVDDKRAEGDDAVVRVHEIGMDLSGTTCRDNMAKAAKAGDDETRALWARNLHDWQISLNEWIAGKLAWKQTRVEKLELHRELFEADLASDRADIEGRLTRILDQTPCGGSDLVEPDPNLTRVRDHEDILRGSSETDAEAYRRLDDYQDHVYVGRDGQVHGDMREGLANAMRDTGLRAPDLATQGAELLLKVQGDYGKLLALGAGEEWIVGWREGRKVLDDFIAAIEALDPAAEDYFKARRLLRTEYLPKLQEALKSGILSENSIDGLLASLKASGVSSGNSADLLRTLERMKVHALGLRGDTLKRLGRILVDADGWADAKGWSEGARAVAVSKWSRYQRLWREGFVTGTGLRFDAGPAWADMSRFQRGMVSLSVAGAMAQTIQRTAQGMPTPEAIYRSSIDLAVDMAVGGVPVLAAAEAATTVLFNGYDALSGQQGGGDATPGNIAKAVAQAVIDKIADGAGYMGHGTVILERWLEDEPGMGEVLAGVDPAKLERALARVESNLDALAPGHPDEDRYMRMRRTFRHLLRAQASAR